MEDYNKVKRKRNGSMPTAEMQSQTLQKLKHEHEAMERLLREEAPNVCDRYWRIKEIYMGRYFRFLKEGNCI